MLFTEKMKQDYLRLCGREIDENGKSYTPLTLPDDVQPVDKSKLTGIATALDFVYGEDKNG